jgi:hypothetical protein
MLSNEQILYLLIKSGEFAYYWHIDIVRELERLRDIGESPYPVTGVIKNTNTIGEGRTACRALIAVGIAQEGVPRWDYDDTWIELADESSITNS